MLARVRPFLRPAIRIRQSTLAISIQKKGVGPALGRGLRAYVDGYALHTSPEVFDALDVRDIRE